VAALVAMDALDPIPRRNLVRMNQHHKPAVAPASSAARWHSTGGPRGWMPKAVESGRVMGIDHGERRIGIALSDHSRTIATGLEVMDHVSRRTDAERVSLLARQQGATLIVVGQSMDEEGRANRAGRRSERFAQALRAITDATVILWDESLSTQDARSKRFESGARRSQRRGHLDDLAAAVMLQSYLDAQRAQPR